MKTLMCKNPKGYNNTKLYFSDKNKAERYVNSLNENFLLKKASLLEHPLSKRRKKVIKFLSLKKYVLTKVGNKFLLWESY